MMGMMATKADISNIDQKFDKMQADISDLKEKSATKTEVSDLASRIQKMELDMKNMREGEFPMDFAASSDHRVDPAMISRLEALEKELKAKDPIKDITMVIGGLKDFATLQEAETFIKNKLWTYWGPTMSDIYTKGDFKGMAFCKFESKENRDKAVNIFDQQRFKHGEHNIWANPDLPVVDRQTNSFLFAAKKTMVGWGWAKTSIYADKALGALTLGNQGAKILSVIMVGGDLTFQIESDWKTEILGDDGNDTSIAKLLEEANTKIKNSGAGTKGLGKGKKGAGSF